MPLTPEEKLAYKRAWLEAHPGYNHAYHQANKQRLRGLNKAWVEANPERKRAIAKAWQINNPEKAAFYRQRGQAKRRSIPFLLTFEEWLAIWQDSGKWELRGRSKGQYVMARIRDQGPYAVGNVYICTSSENCADIRKNRAIPIANSRLPHPR